MSETQAHSPGEAKPLHHMTDEEFEAHFNEKYGAVAPDVDEAAVDIARRMLGPESDDAWVQHQNERYADTKEITEVRRELLSEIYEFVNSEAPAAKLFELMDPSIAGEHDPGRRLAAYERVCERFFEFRKGPNGEIRERQDVAEVLTAAREVVGADLWDTTMEVCGEMGMVQNSELRDNDTIKCLGILGGTESAIRNRTRYTIEQLEAHNATTESFDFLVSEGEMGFALKEIAHLGVEAEELSRQEYPSGTIMNFAPVTIAGKEVPIRILIGKANNGRTRATTLDTMRLWREASNVQPDDRMVASTTGLYTAFQKANAREVITWDTGLEIDVIGHSADWAGGQRTANQLLQEFKAAVDSHGRLYRKMIEAGLVPATPERYEVDIDALYEPVPSMDNLRKQKEGYTSEPIDVEHPLYKEEVVNIGDYGLAGQAYYSRPNAATGEGVPGVPPELRMRRSTAEQLQRINKSLSDPAITALFGGEVELYIEDAVRQIEMQRDLHDRLVPALIKKQEPGIDAVALAARVKDMIAIPANNPNGPSPHLTGAAFDIVLRYKQADKGFVPDVNVPMGHVDGETSPRLNPDHFEDQPPATEEDRIAQRNRRAFNGIMTGKVFGVETGFVPNPTEWFHWSRGDQLWARVQHASGNADAQPYYSIAPGSEATAS